MELTVPEIRSAIVYALGGALSPEREAEIGAAFDNAIRLDKASAFDQGVSIAGRYGHEDGWSGGGPYAQNPWRTPEELEELGYGEDEDW
ncbi:hypothetical protein SEA_PAULODIABOLI_56 [Microbacterium phage PauloDiaboli]|nr:hypothetical protein SEA_PAULODIABOLI_56 [Microbacterium phage PauloDiaboli]